MDHLEVLDLDADRQRRAAEREGRGDTLPIKVGGQVVATLPPELPIDVLTPLRDIDEDIALLLSTVMRTATAEGRTQQQALWETTGIVVDMLVSNPRLPVTVLDVIQKIAARLLTEEGFAALMAARPSREDLGFLAKHIFLFYGVSLGEASRPPDSSPNGGPTSSTTSSSTSGSTPEDSSPDQEAMAS